MNLLDKIQPYGYFPDAVLHAVNFDFPKKGKQTERVLSLQIEVRNQLKEWGWENIILELHGIKHFGFTEGNSSNQIFNHVYFQELDGLYLIDFAGFESTEHTLESIQKSPFYCVCEAIKVKTT